MPRKSRIDAPGALHHIVFRGIERGNIFRDNKDRDNFLDRLGGVLQETVTACYAWALIPNHGHLLLKTGSTPTSKVMQRVLTGHATYFNRRHSRHGKLLQNRYKSILCQEDAYLLELIRYIHLNPVRSGVIKGFKALDTYKYTGHSALMGNMAREWQDVSFVLRHFSKTLSQARRYYREFIEKGVDPGMVWKKGKYPDIVKARSLFCYWSVRELGITNRTLASQLRLSQPAVSISVKRGEKLAEDLNLKLIEKRDL